MIVALRARLETGKLPQPREIGQWIRTWPPGTPVVKISLAVLPLGADVPNDLSQVLRFRTRKGDEPVMHDPQQRQVS